jgi:hypothetical protein
LPFELFAWLCLICSAVLFVFLLRINARRSQHLFFVDPGRAAGGEERPAALRQLRQVLGVDTGSLMLAQFVALFNQTSLEVSWRCEM